VEKARIERTKNRAANGQKDGGTLTNNPQHRNPQKNSGAAATKKPVNH